MSTIEIQRNIQIYQTKMKACIVGGFWQLAVIHAEEIKAWKKLKPED